MLKIEIMPHPAGPANGSRLTNCPCAVAYHCARGFTSPIAHARSAARFDPIEALRYE